VRSQHSLFSLRRGSRAAGGRIARNTPNSVPEKRDWNYPRRSLRRPPHGDFFESVGQLVEFPGANDDCAWSLFRNNDRTHAHVRSARETLGTHLRSRQVNPPRVPVLSRPSDCHCRSPRRWRRIAHQARALHHQAKPHLRPGAGRFRQGQRRPKPHRLRRESHTKASRAGPAVRAARQIFTAMAR
jgi:hypothetical protein